MAKTYTPDGLARHVFILVMIGIAGEIAVMVYFGWLA